MEHEIVVGSKLLILKHSDLVEEINVEDTISIDYSNLAGEAHVTPLVSNAIGMYRSDLEKEVKELELAIKVFVAKYKQDRRVSAARDGKKVTEKELESAYFTEKEWQNLNNDLFLKQSFLSKIDVVYWKTQDKLERLKMYIKEVLPEEFSEDVLEKAYNGMFEQVKGLK